MEVKEYTFRNGDYSFSILNLGCAVTSICCPDRDGNVKNVTLPFKGVLEDPSVIYKDPFFGMTVGRFANRIGHAQFTLNGKKYSFEPNDNGNFLHSGPNGLWTRTWQVRHEDDGFTCSIKVKDMDDGFPGDLDLRVRFSMSADGVFKIHYSATCSQECPLNITNHTYFNLSGDPEKPITGHLAKLNSSKIVEADGQLIPTGKLLDVTGTTFDFRTEKTIGEGINDPVLTTGGYDHAFVIDRMGDESRGFTWFAHMYDKESGRIMQAFTDLPAFQFYTGNFLDKDQNYPKHCGFCLETSYYPDCPNQSNFPSCNVKPGELFESTTVYHFYTDKTKN